MLCLSDWVFVSNKRQNGLTDRAQIVCRTSNGPREGLWMIKFKKLASNKIRFSFNFENPRNNLIKSAILFVFVLQCIQRENVHN